MESDNNEKNEISSSSESRDRQTKINNVFSFEDKRFTRTRTIDKILPSWFQNIRDKIPQGVQLCILYFCLGILAAIGGTIFNSLEYDTEQSELSRKLAIWQDLQQNGDFTEAQLEEIRDWSDNYAQLFTDANKWELHYSAFFAATTYTTVGYGLQAPATIGGKLFVILWGLPAILLYGTIAKKVGTICMYFIHQCTIRCGVSEESYYEHRLKFIGIFYFIGFMAMSTLIWQTATDVGFGHAIYSFGDAVYFLYTTTATIGYGDVMMSGSNPILTVLIGLWLASTLGLAICFAQEMSQTMMRSKNASIPNMSKYIEEIPQEEVEVESENLIS